LITQNYKYKFYECNQLQTICNRLHIQIVLGAHDFFFEIVFGAHNFSFEIVLLQLIFKGNRVGKLFSS